MASLRSTGRGIHINIDPSSSLIAQAITAVAALGGVLVGTFGGESYRRFSDATALAAALLGELSSIGAALGVLNKMVEAQLKAIDNGTKIPKVESPSRPPTIFDANLQRIGILGAKIAKDLAFTYHMIGAVQASMRTGAAADDATTKRASLAVAQQFIANAQDAMPGLLRALETRSSRRWLGLLP